jgi:3-hydroxyisobutyrate dehydrogenase/2-hydroxy-3-oxopropionate reductase
MAPTVGFLGMGRMGRRIAPNIARAGFPLIVYNRTRPRAEDVAEQAGASVGRTPAEVARAADVVITMLADGPALEAVYEGPEGVLAGLGPGAVAIDMSTVGPGLVLSLGERVRARGATMVDSPVSGSVATAESATLMLMVGGDEADVARVRPVLESAGRPVIHVGPPGAGAAMKLAVNAMIFAINQSLSESLVLAERAGIARETAYEVFANSAAAAPVVHYRRPVFEHPGELPPSFTLDLAAKDLRLILELGAQVGAPMPQSERNLQVIEDAIAANRGARDLGELAEFLRSAAEDGRPA